MKKINAVSALLTEAVLALHLWVMTWSLCTGWYDPFLCKTIGGILCGLFAVHAALTICIFFFCHDGTDLSCRRQNLGTILQRAAAVLMLLLIHSHARAYSFMATGEHLTAAQTVFTGITEALLIFAVCLHAALSPSRALISLGVIRTERARAVTVRISSLIFGVSGIAALAAMIRFFAVI